MQDLENKVVDLCGKFGRGISNGNCLDIMPHGFPAKQVPSFFLLPTEEPEEQVTQTEEEQQWAIIAIKSYFPFHVLLLFLRVLIPQEKHSQKLPSYCYLLLHKYDHLVTRMRHPQR